MKHAKKLASLLLALVMVLSMSVTAFAAGEKSTLTINTTAGHTYNVYQLLVGDVANLTDGSGTLSNVAVGQNMKADTTVEAFMTAINGKADAELGDIAYSYIKEGSTPIATITSDKNTAEVANGYYIVTDSYDGAEVTDGSDTVSRYMVAVVGDTTMTPKTETPSIDKKIVDTDANAPIDGANAKTNTAAIGDEINYKITGTVPDTAGYEYYYYVVNDTLSAGLTLDQESFVVTIGTGDTATTLVKGTDYYVYFDANTNSFQLALKDLKKMVEVDKTINVNDPISITYNATINDAAVIGTDPNTNTAKLQYSNNPGSSEQKDVTGKPGVPDPGNATGEGPTLTTKTYVTELTILKVDENGEKLTGAQFTLTGKNLNKVIVNDITCFRPAVEGETATYYKLKDGTYTETAPSNAQEGEAGYNADKYESTTPGYVRETKTTSTEATGTGDNTTITGTVDDEGRIVFTGLNAGKYTLTETVAPDGYNKIAPIEFTISATQTGSSIAEGGTVTWASDNELITLDGNNGIFDATIENREGSTLPSTGGIGTTIFYVVGSILLVGAVVLLIAKRRMSAE